jgi:hypothetical protein
MEQAAAPDYTAANSEFAVIILFNWLHFTR